MSSWALKQKGFTIVELLIVIVVIGILAALVLNSFAGVQKKARDAKRADDIAQIKRSLEVYRINNGHYPTATPSPGQGSGWEASTDASGSFMEYLQSAGLGAGTPVDPINSVDNNYYYRYHYYPPGGYAGNGCDTSLGNFYVLIVIFEDAANKPAGNAMSDECTSPQTQWSDVGPSHTILLPRVRESVTSRYGS